MRQFISYLIYRLHLEQWENHQTEQFSFSWIGHSSILISMESQRILVDPVLEERASPFSWIGPKRFHPSPVTAEDLPGVDVVLITHDHYDHLEKSTLVAINEKVGCFIVPLGIGKLLKTGSHATRFFGKNYLKKEGIHFKVQAVC